MVHLKGGSSREDEAIARIAREARAVAAAQAEVQRQALDDAAASAKPRKKVWQYARQQRKQAMLDWDDIERLDGAGLKRPGREIPRHGADRSVPNPAVTRRFPRPPGQGIE